MSKRRARKKKKRQQRTTTVRRHFILGPARKHFTKHFETYPQHERHLDTFTSDITANPYHCEDDPDRIRKLTWTSKMAAAGYPRGSYRWKQKDLRIVYEIDKTMFVVTPLAAGTAGKIPYR